MTAPLSRRVLATYIATQLLEGADQKHLSRQLAAYLIESRRTKELGVIVRDIQAQLAKLGHATGTVTTAHNLSDQTLSLLESYAKKSTGAKTIHLDTVTDSSVLGGVRLQLAGHELNATISHQLLQLKTKRMHA